MTHKEKSAELLMKFQNIEALKDFGGMDIDIAKQCAIVAVKEIALKLNGHHKDAIISPFIEYWQEVLTELERM